MFVPSFFTGSLITRFGVERVLAAGMVLLSMAGIAGLTGISFANFAVGLVLLGIGWNFGYVGGTAMVTECYRASEKSKVQAVNDFCVLCNRGNGVTDVGQVAGCDRLECSQYGTLFQ